MKDTIRTFIAIKITPGKKLIELINNFKKSLSEEEIRWVDTYNLHLTLRFLGETSKEQTQEIIKTLETIPQRFQPFQFNLKGVGFFKRKNQPKVLFAAVEKDLILKQLANEIEEKIIQLGFRHGEKIFNPHLTIGRFKYISDKDSFYSMVNRFLETKIQQVTVSEIIFYQSILSSKGPTYKPIKILSLN